MSPRRSDRYPLLRPLIDRALELPPEARAAWLAEQRAANPELVAELETILANEADLDRLGFLDEAGREALRRWFPPAPERPDSAGSG